MYGRRWPPQPGRGGRCPSYLVGSAGGSFARSAAAAARGSSAPVTAAATATHRTPVASTWPTLSAVMPAMATAGIFTLATAAAAYGRPGAMSRGLVVLRKTGADADVVGPVGHGPLGVGDLVRADADDFAHAEQLADLGGRQVVLADVDAVGPAQQGHVGAVVDDGQHVVAAAEGDEPAGAGQQLAAVEGLLPQLQGVGPAGDGLLGRVLPGVAAGRFGDQHVQPHGGEAGDRVQGAGQLLLDGVEPVADRLQAGGPAGIEGFGVLLQRPDGLAQPLAGGGDHIAQVGAVPFGGHRDRGADVAGRVAVQDGGGQERAGGGRQLVTERLQLGGQAVVVQHESGVILQHPQRLAGPVGAGVEQPLHLTIHVSRHRWPIIGPASPPASGRP